MTMGYMTVRLEAWPLAADDVGLWLVSGDDAWRSDLPVPADSDPHAEVELLLGRHHAGGRAALLHSTSWRTEGQQVILTWVAAFNPPVQPPDRHDLVLDDWPNARPLSTALADEVGRAPRHSPTDPPEVRYVDVLLHALRHVRLLTDTDDDVRAALAPVWLEHLKGFGPALAGMYGQAR